MTFSTLITVAPCMTTCTITITPSEAIAITRNALEGATLRAARSSGWERKRALDRCVAYRAEIAKLAAMVPAV